MTEQEVFDKVAVHLLTQKVKAINNTGMCMYRTESGLKCAIGCLIADEDYDKVMDESELTISKLLNSSISLDKPSINAFRHINLELLKKFQEIHDKSSKGNWKNKLSILADEFDLNKSVLENFNDIS